MDNFRGFTDALIPLKQVNFLVGENSTGKSSFLTLLAMLNDPEFWINPSFQFPNHFTESLYSDLISAWAKDKSFFQVGVVNILPVTQGNVTKFRLDFSVNLFREQENHAKLFRHARIEDEEFVLLDFHGPRIKYSCYTKKEVFESTEDAVAQFKAIAKALTQPGESMKTFPKGTPSFIPLPLATSIMHSLIQDENKSSKRKAFDVHLPMNMDVRWVAPIRTRPRRIYDITHSKYSPEGEHTPLLLRKSLRSRNSKFAQKLAEFGDASGLFDTVIAHSFGKGPKTPFELLIKFKGADLNINNVGYGVSQALPLIVEFLTERQQKVFAVQQPEVHLHPKAQAALGGLIFHLFKEAEHSFFIETHSDYLIDRFRLSMRADSNPPESQIIFFHRNESGNTAYPLSISKTGLYPQCQPDEFRDFFIKEEIKLLDL